MVNKLGKPNLWSKGGRDHEFATTAVRAGRRPQRWATLPLPDQWLFLTLFAGLPRKAALARVSDRHQSVVCELSQCDQRGRTKGWRFRWHRSRRCQHENRGCGATSVFVLLVNRKSCWTCGFASWLRSCSCCVRSCTIIRKLNWSF